MINRTIIIGMMIYYNNNCKLHFGDYSHNHESHNKITGTTRTIGAL